MRYSGVVGARCWSAVIVGLSTCCGMTMGAEPTTGTATIGAPVTAVTAPTPMAESTPHASIVPTPIVPYASKGTDLEPGPKDVVASEPTTAAAPPTIEAGDLVPVTITATPNVTAKPATPEAAVRSEVKPESLTSTEELTPIRPAVVSRQAPSVPVIKEKKAKKVAASAEPAAPESPSNPPDRAEPPAVRFSFPQPVIPLESALRRWFGRTLGR